MTNICVWEGETMARLSHDQVLVEQLKQQFGQAHSHNWQEQYDDEGRLLSLNLKELDLAQVPQRDLANHFSANA